MILGNVLGSVRFSNYLPDEEVCEIIMRLQQYYDVHFTEATYYLKKQMFYFNFAEDNSAIVRVFPLEDYYKLDPNNKMEEYKFGILYINEEYRTTLINFGKYKLVMFAMAKLMEMKEEQQNQVALYLFNHIK